MAHLCGLVLQKRITMGIGVLVVLLLLISLSQGAIISQSTISDCSWGDEAEPTAPGGEVCKKKMLISMVLGSGQVRV